MKTTMKQLAAGTFIALLLMVGNVNAKGTEVSAISQETETTLQIENWMIDENLWDTKSFINYEIAQEIETTLELEDWMKSEETWKINNNFVEETETELTVESWMTSESIWSE